MSFDKTKFTAQPQKDSEGFTDYEARCLGCPNSAPCPRSGHCLRYNSPLRDQEVPTPWSDIPDTELNAFVDNWRNSTMVRT